MAEGNRGQKAEAGRGTQAERKLGDRVQDVGQRLRESAGEAERRIQEGYDSARDYAAGAYGRYEDTVAEHPATSVLVGFGLGFGLGLLLTTLLSEREPDPWYSRYMPEAMRNLPDRLGDWNLRGAISERLPRM
jgi:ElaB/YqjD/DUF883 family membrane-anchored ribosome-binding protein